jgi:hypothetical protein
MSFTEVDLLGFYVAAYSVDDGRGVAVRDSNSPGGNPCRAFAELMAPSPAQNCCHSFLPVLAHRRSSPTAAIR